MSTPKRCIVQNIIADRDLFSEIGLAVTETISQENEGRSGAMAQSSAFSFGGKHAPVECTVIRC